MAIPVTPPWSSLNSRFMGAGEKKRATRRESLLPNICSRFLAPILFYSSVGLFWGLFVVLFLASISGRIARELLSRWWSAWSSRDSLEDLITEEEMKLCLSDHKVIELGELEELCSDLSPTPSRDSSSETLLGSEDPDDRFAEAESAPIVPIPLVYFLHRKLEGLPLRPDTPFHPTIRLPRLDKDGTRRPYGQTRLIHGSSPLSSSHLPLTGNESDEEVDEDYDNDKDDSSSIDTEELPEGDWSYQDDPVVTRRDGGLPRVRKFVSLPCILAPETAYDMDHLDRRRMQLSRKEREAMFTFLSE